ncbi:MAG: 1-deoxy-D-xylulose-5-phosphate synthase [Ruminococcus sp.]
MYLEKINAPEDVRQLNTEELRALAEEMRQALLFRLSRHGGHFGPNFGMVEATIALHYVFDSPRDKIVYDVSHQSYPHKMLTGRKNAYLSEEHFEDVSGYTNPEESEHDFFNVGHTSTSVSLASGLAKARDLKGEDGNVIAVIGDGSLSGGEALEGLDFAGEMHSNFIVVINDNDMSIAENHGGLYRNLKLLRDTDGKAECNLFRAMGLDYVFVKDGNDIEALIAAFRQVKDSKTPVAVHIVTQKGKGYALAEQHKEEWHWHLPFDIATGKTTVPAGGEKDYDTVTAEYILKKMQEDASVCAITSATPTVFGFTKELRERAGKQFIAWALQRNTLLRWHPALPKTAESRSGACTALLQRTYDQISQDICINQNAVTIAVYTASVYGMNDVTHLGIYDIPMISNIPNLVYLAPVTAEDYLAMLDWSLEQTEHPVAIRVPIQYISDGKPVTKDFGDLNRYEMTQEGSEIAIVALGSFYPLGVAAAEKIAQKTGITPTLINPYYITGLDTDCLEQLKKNHRVVLTLEDGVLDGGFGEKIARFYGDSKVRTKCFGLKKEFLDRYEVSEVLRENHLTAEQIAEDAVTMLAE